MYKFHVCLFAMLCLFVGCEPALSDSSSGEVEIVDTETWALRPFVKADSLNPILEPTPALSFTDPISGEQVQWESRNVLNPSAVVKDGMVNLFYRAQDESGTSRIGLATSTDGLNFKKRSEPVFYPDNDAMKTYEWNYRKISGEAVPEGCTTCYFDGVEDPRIIEDTKGTYFMTYTAYDGKTARLAIASSTDLLNWTKHGLVLNDPADRDRWSKSGAIVVERIDSRNVAKKIDGKYWMYFGDTDLFMATSEDLISWEVIKNEENNAFISVLHPRPGFFDSRLVEPGPYALYREDGILMIYNGSNAANFNDPELPRFTYAAGQALFAKEAPYRLTDRLDEYFLYPDQDYEKVGEVNEVCFVEGMVYFNAEWFLYYGTADTKIAVATHAGVR